MFFLLIKNVVVANFMKRQMSHDLLPEIIFGNYPRGLTYILNLINNKKLQRSLFLLINHACKKKLIKGRTIENTT